MEKRVKKIISSNLEMLKKSIIDRHIAIGQQASGRTVRSLKVELTDDGGILWGRKAFGVLEIGRKAGKVPKGFPQIIEQWVKDKGIEVERPKSFAYLVARKIAREGTELSRSGKTLDIFSSATEETIQRILEDIIGVYSMTVEHININTVKQ